nr:hypothetical protein [uncultured Roseibium sp.]
MADATTEAFLNSLSDLYVAGTLLKNLEPGYKFIKSEYDAAFYYSLSSEYYDIAAKYQTALNTAIAGAVAVCTFAVGGWAIQFLGSGARLGVAATGTSAPFLYGGGSIPIYVVPTATKIGLGVTIASGGVLANAILKSAAGSGGDLRFMDIPKIGFLVAGGVAGAGPLVGLLFGTLGSVGQREAREKFTEIVCNEASAALLKKAIETKMTKKGTDIAAMGRHVKIGFLPITRIGDLLRTPLMRDIDKITKDIVKKESGTFSFSSPNYDEIYSKVHGKIGTRLWAPILSDVARAYTQLQIDYDRAEKVFLQASADWMDVHLPGFRFR